MIDEKKLIEIVNTDEWKYRLIRNPISIQEALSETIESMPRVGEWIPCSERLPEESGKYLGQRPYGDIIDIEFSKKHQKWNAHDSRPPKYAIEVIAWMPLPEPYEKEIADRVGGVEREKGE